MGRLFQGLAGGLLWLACFTAYSATSPEVVELQTNLGTIAIKLDYQKAPITANNFMAYVDGGFYKNTLIHRVIKGFVLQGGGFDRATGRQKTTFDPITNEAANGLSNLAGTIAMARTSNPDSATSQFFINLANNTFLDYVSGGSAGYAVFGKVIKGMEIAQAIGGLVTYNEFPYTAADGTVFIDAVYASDQWRMDFSVTRVTVVGSGKVTSLPEGIACGTACTLSQVSSGKVKLTAVPTRDYVFIGWRGDCRGIRVSLQVDTAHGNHNCTAVFAKQMPMVQ